MDRNFDSLIFRFQKNIYDGPKGAIRLAVVWDDLQEFIPTLQGKKPLRILDAGAGFGQLAQRLAKAGHELVLCDISKAMLQQAEAVFTAELPDARVEFVQSSIQDYCRESLQQFDVVLCHAVLEWLAEPEAVLRRLIKQIRPGGHLSLMFYNKHAVVLRNLLRGNFIKVKSGSYHGDPNSLTPNQPLMPDDVYSWLEHAGVEVLLRSGVRVVYDYLSQDLRQQRSLDDIIEMEKMHSRHEPYRSMGRYIHVIGRVN